MLASEEAMAEVVTVAFVAVADLQIVTPGGLS